MSDYPELNELVVCKIKSVKGYGVFVDLLEYEKEGFVHISQIASGWIKNVRSHVSEGQIRVAQVTHIDKEKGMIDVSFRKVSDGQEKRKMSSYKLTNRANKLFEHVAKQLKEDPEESYPIIAEPLKAEYGELYAAFEAMSSHGMEALEDVDIPKKWGEALVKFAEETVTAPEVTITRKLTLKSYASDGVNDIRNALQELEKHDLKAIYVSAPEYSVSATAGDYLEAERMLKKGIESIEKIFKKHGEISIERAQK